MSCIRLLGQEVSRYSEIGDKLGLKSLEANSPLSLAQLQKGETSAAQRLNKAGVLSPLFSPLTEKRRIVMGAAENKKLLKTRSRVGTR